jgi:hypothetical protein
VDVYDVKLSEIAQGDRAELKVAHLHFGRETFHSMTTGKETVSENLNITGHPSTKARCVA